MIAIDTHRLQDKDYIELIEFLTIIEFAIDYTGAIKLDANTKKDIIELINNKYDIKQMIIRAHKENYITVIPLSEHKEKYKHIYSSNIVCNPYRYFNSNTYRHYIAKNKYNMLIYQQLDTNIFKDYNSRIH